MMVINAAYKVLRDPNQRAKYDRKRCETQKQSTNTMPGQGSVNKSTNTAMASQNPILKDIDTEPVESLADIVSDIVCDLAFNQGGRLLQDFMEFLEKVVGIHGISPHVRVY